MKKKNDGVKAVGRVSAVIAMVVLILAAIPVGACISLSRERNNVTAEYYGSDDVYGVLDQVSMMVSEASNLVTIAEKYSETDLTLVDAVRTAQNAVKKAERPADKYAALNDLTTAVKAMYRQIKNIDMNEEDATYRESLMSNYNSDLDYLMRDDYNDKAAAFNDALHNSPAYALAKLVGIGDVEQARQPFFTTRPELERSGMGFTVMEAFMEEVFIESSPGEGTSVTMKKRIARRDAP